ncbi:PREDICTED: uncharacterized protein LOC104726229 isoform X2 [Camelina sativa]|uniref:Uncharacterized protein LOC104726229 isoform X2 n=1 Tax=Camelina sativa TaxID=90675 RepID=A0ABM1QKD3_CAMSA|nr:PREDICTED: uncharacterized protein LOC104726229 isoform X2 [Camelina sativa]
MPGTIQVSVLGLIDDVQTSSHQGSSNTSIKVAMGKLEYRTSDSGDYIFPVTRLRENLIVSLLDVNGNRILHREIETRIIIENGFLEEKLSFNGYGNVQLKMQFVLTEEDRNRIRFLRQSALRKKHEELVNGTSFTKSKSIASDLSTLSPMQTRDIVAVANPKKILGLSRETELEINADREQVSSNLIMWKPEVNETVQPKKEEKPKIQLSSSYVSSSKKLPEIKKVESVLLVKQEDKGLSIPERNLKRESMRRSMSETNLTNVRKMISNFEDTKIRKTKIQTGSCKDVEEKTKAQSQQESAVTLEKPEERKISFKDMEKPICIEDTERCDDLVIVSRNERTIVIEEKSDSLSKLRRKRSSVVEVRDDEKKPNKSVRFKDSQQENARGSRLWIFPDEAKDLSCEKTDFGERVHLDLAEADLLQKNREESTRENIGERGIRCRSIVKVSSHNKWENIERSKKHKTENSADSESSHGPVGQVMRALIVAGFAGLVFLTRQRT